MKLQTEDLRLPSTVLGKNINVKKPPRYFIISEMIRKIPQKWVK
jgi:hypothetical protein